MKSIVLNIGGQDRTFHFGLGFLGNLLENENIQLHEISAKLLKNSYKWMPLVMYHSLAWGYIRKNENVPFDVLDIADWIDELTEFDDVEVVLANETTTVKLQTVVRTFFTSFWGSINNNVPTDTSKKKVTKK